MENRNTYLENRRVYLEEELERSKESINSNYKNRDHFDSDLHQIVRDYRTRLKLALKRVLEDIGEDL